MTNKEISKTFKLTAQLMELHEENSFKIKSYSNAAFKIDRLPKQLNEYSVQEISNLEGIGKSISACISQLLSLGNFPELSRIIEITPPGVIEMLAIKGVGPKKIAVIWKTLNIESPGELLYACNENRLIDLKGFGLKTQLMIKQAIEYKISNSGKFHYAMAAMFAKQLVDFLKESLKTELISLTGEIRRKCEIVTCIDVLISAVKEPEISAFNDAYNPSSIPVNFILCHAEDFYLKLFETTASSDHIAIIQKNSAWENIENQKYSNEKDIYSKINLPFIIPELREGKFEFSWIKDNKEEDLISYEDLKGVLHVHTTYSDGMHSLEEMAVHCKKSGFEYLGICDHSQSAFYANGLKPDRILAQQMEIDLLNQKLFPFKIFKGIESDILNSGELDYSEEILKTFDFVVASVHSNLKMDEEKATMRLLKAIENPYTTILGHMTGRLLLSREGYPVNYEKIIDACAANNVIIELNAHPYRLDMDWRKIPYAINKGVKISINPDSHQKESYNDMYWGTCAARKGGLIKAMTFNTLSISEIENYFRLKKTNTSF
ncbi:MAG: DNA polymerase/3'-5' exonuclease PolX [Bacteroidetes bacterium]|nr:DNA polymerase/3'-5' exonuclease PolX [Bacteroidota bacterium]